MAWECPTNFSLSRWAERVNAFDKTICSIGYRRAFVLLIGWAAVTVPAAVYMQVNGAMVPMIRTLLFGPGEFLLSRLAVPLSPLAPVLLIASLALIAYSAYKLRARPAAPVTLWVILIAGISFWAVWGRQADINQIILYLPMLVRGRGDLLATEPLAATTRW
jgi:hypothetical protein